jgi:hypothetical protein
MKKLQLPKRLPHFEGALNLDPPEGNKAEGLCFHRTVGFVLDTPMAKLCVGTFRAATPEELHFGAQHGYDLSPEDFIHCWPEVGDIAFMLAAATRRNRTINRVSRTQYYQQNGTTNVVSLSRARLKQLSRQYGLAQHLLYHAPLVGEAKFASVILDELGVNHVISNRGGLIPGVGGDESLQLPDMLGINDGR